LSLSFGFELADLARDAVELVLESSSRVWDVTVVPKDPPLPWAFDAIAPLT